MPDRLHLAHASLGRLAVSKEDLDVIPLSDWLPLCLAGLMFTSIGVLKLWGLTRGIIGGADKPAVQRLCGT